VLVATPTPLSNDRRVRLDVGRRACCHGRSRLRRLNPLQGNHGILVGNELGPSCAVAATNGGHRTDVALALGWSEHCDGQPAGYLPAGVAFPRASGASAIWTRMVSAWMISGVEIVTLLLGTAASTAVKSLVRTVDPAASGEVAEAAVEEILRATLRAGDDTRRRLSSIEAKLDRMATAPLGTKMQVGYDNFEIARQASRTHAERDTKRCSTSSVPRHTPKKRRRRWRQSSKPSF
jgi:hypothetical protein